MIEASLHQSLILKSFRLPSDYCESPHLSVLDILNEKNEGDIQYKEREEGSIRIPILVEGQRHTNIDSDFDQKKLGPRILSKDMKRVEILI